MKLSFRQGLVSFQQDANGRPQFLKSSTKFGYVALNVSPTPTVVTFAHKSSNYLQVFDQTSATSWGPLVANNDNYLYWDIDLLTGEVTAGITIREPIASSLEPAKTEDQHWFDLNDNVMKVWSERANKWVPKIRAFAGMVENGSTNQIKPNIYGSQVGLVTDSVAGYIMLDTQLRPLRTSTGEFLTTQTDVRVKTTSGTSGVLAKPLNSFVPVRAGENIPAMSVVAFSRDDEVVLANSDPAKINERTPVGLIQQSLAINEIGDLTQRGEISYDQWDWGDNAGSPIYFDNYGKLTLVRPQGLLAYFVGVVKNKNTIIFNIDAETQPQVYQAQAAEMVVSGISPIVTTRSTNSIGEVVSTISILPATAATGGAMTPAQAQLIEGIGPRFQTVETNITALNVSKAPARHTHVTADITDLQPILDSKMSVNKNFDDRYAPININFDSRYAPLNHTHQISNVINLQSTLDSKANRFGTLTAISSIWESVDKSGTVDVGSGQQLSSILSGKANAVHAHAIDDVSGLRDELAAKALINHTHNISNITNLQTTLDSKVSLTGNQVMTGQLTMTVEPSLDFHLATKQYVDTKLGEGGEVGPLDLFDLTNTDDPYRGDYGSGTLLAFNSETRMWEPQQELKVEDLTNVNVGYFDGVLFEVLFGNDISIVQAYDGFEMTDSQGYYTNFYVNDTLGLLTPEDTIAITVDFDFRDESYDGGSLVFVRASDSGSESLNSFNLYRDENNSMKMVYTDNNVGKEKILDSLTPSLRFVESASKVDVFNAADNSLLVTVQKASDVQEMAPLRWIFSNMLSTAENVNPWHITHAKIELISDDYTTLLNGSALVFDSSNSEWKAKRLKTTFEISKAEDFQQPYYGLIEDGSTLVYNTNTKKWHAQKGGSSGAESIYDLIDVENKSYGSANHGDFLVWNDGAKMWQPKSIDEIFGVYQPGYILETGSSARFEAKPKERKYVVSNGTSILNSENANKFIKLEGQDGATFTIVADDMFEEGDTLTLVSMGENFSIVAEDRVELLPTGNVQFDSKYGQIQLVLIEKGIVNGSMAYKWLVSGFRT